MLKNWTDRVDYGMASRFWTRGIIAPFFFEHKQREAVTINGDRYRAMLNEFLYRIQKVYSIQHTRYKVMCIG